MVVGDVFLTKEGSDFINLVVDSMPLDGAYKSIFISQSDLVSTHINRDIDYDSTLSNRIILKGKEKRYWLKILLNRDGLSDEEKSVIKRELKNKSKVNRL